MHTDQVGEALKPADEGKQTHHRFSGDIARLHLFWSSVSYDDIRCSCLYKWGFWTVFAENYWLYQMQRNLWYPRWILLCGKGICSVCLHTFRTVKENATPFEIVNLPQNGILRTKLERPFPYFAWSTLWGKIDRRFLSNLPHILHGIQCILGWNSLDYLVLYLVSLSLSWKKSL